MVEFAKGDRVVARVPYCMPRWGYITSPPNPCNPIAYVQMFSPRLGRMAHSRVAYHQKFLERMD